MSNERVLKLRTWSELLVVPAMAISGVLGIAVTWVDACHLLPDWVVHQLGFGPLGCKQELFPPLTPSFRLWVFLFGVQVALWSAVLLLTWGSVMDAYQRLTSRSARITSLLIVSLVLLLGLAIAMVKPKGFEDQLFAYSPIPQQRFKSYLPVFGVLAVAIPVAGMVFVYVAAVARQNWGTTVPLATGMELVANEQERLKGWLWLVGTVIGAATLGTGAFRNAVLDAAKCTPEETSPFPFEYLLIYSVAFSLLVAIVYVPTSNALLNEARTLRDEAIKDKLPKTTLDDALARTEWAKTRKEVTEALNLEKGLQEALTTGLGVLGPLIGALISRILPKVTE